MMCSELDRQRHVVIFLQADDYAASLFFYNYTASPEIYTLSLHDALPILRRSARVQGTVAGCPRIAQAIAVEEPDRKSTRLNSSHTVISYAVFCLKKKKKWD